MRDNPRKLTLSTKLLFGKYKNSNKTVYELLKEDIVYCNWLIDIWQGEVDYKVNNMFRELWKKRNNTISVEPFKRIDPKD